MSYFSVNTSVLRSIVFTYVNRYSVWIKLADGDNHRGYT